MSDIRASLILWWCAIGTALIELAVHMIDAGDPARTAHLPSVLLATGLMFTPQSRFYGIAARAN